MAFLLSLNRPARIVDPCVSRCGRIWLVEVRRGAARPLVRAPESGRLIWREGEGIGGLNGEAKVVSAVSARMPFDKPSALREIGVSRIDAGCRGWRGWPRVLPHASVECGALWKSRMTIVVSEARADLGLHVACGGRLTIPILRATQ